ncbi:hypothetical protein P7K49_020322 [Saguinus oedipus]|uniref:L-serine ammonia-lyase n=1 Tax=Saguinus oedipus TaxID=9490 RepID=A0ABQ9V0M1_SAGOE|nr:hypothetical protein P7K49_020322 [Saguinus oedipus]
MYVFTMMSREPLHVKTPIRDSMALSKVAGTSVYLKMDSAQPSGSFKIRGIGHFCKRVRDQLSIIWAGVAGPPFLTGQCQGYVKLKGFLWLRDAPPGGSLGTDRRTISRLFSSTPSQASLFGGGRCSLRKGENKFRVKETSVSTESWQLFQVGRKSTGNDGDVGLSASPVVSTVGQARLRTFCLLLR